MRLGSRTWIEWLEIRVWSFRKYELNNIQVIHVTDVVKQGRGYWNSIIMNVNELSGGSKKAANCRVHECAFHYIRNCCICTTFSFFFSGHISRPALRKRWNDVNSVNSSSLCDHVHVDHVHSPSPTGCSCSGFAERPQIGRFQQFRRLYKHLRYGCVSGRIPQQGQPSRLFCIGQRFRWRSFDGC